MHWTFLYFGKCEVRASKLIAQFLSSLLFAYSRISMCMWQKQILVHHCRRRNSRTRSKFPVQVLSTNFGKCESTLINKSLWIYILRASLIHHEDMFRCRTIRCIFSKVECLGKRSNCNTRRICTHSPFKGPFFLFTLNK